MKGLKGIKGKWEIRKRSRFSQIINANGLVISEVYNTHTVEAFANAQLISKSPEILEMLQACINILGDVPLGAEMKEWVQNAEQLIKEATMR